MPDNTRFHTILYYSRDGHADCLARSLLDGDRSRRQRLVGLA